MPDGSAAGRCEDTLAERYEQLRAAALGGRADGWRLGLGVLAGRGVAAWIRAWTACPNPAPPAATPAAARPVRADAPAGAQTADLVRVLAAMALAHA